MNTSRVIRLIEMTMTGSKTRTRTKDVTDPITIEKGVREGDAL